MLRIWHPEHRTAWSARTSGFPLLGLSPEGIVWRGETSKRAQFLYVPDSTRLIAWCYSSNSGRRSITFLKPENYLPSVRTIHEYESPDDLRVFLEERGLASCLDVLEVWLWGR